LNSSCSRIEIVKKQGMSVPGGPCCQCLGIYDTFKLGLAWLPPHQTTHGVFLGFMLVDGFCFFQVSSTQLRYHDTKPRSKASCHLYFCVWWTKKIKNQENALSPSNLSYNYVVVYMHAMDDNNLLAKILLNMVVCKEDPCIKWGWSQI